VREAIATGQRAVDINKGDFLAHYNLACAYAQDRDPQVRRSARACGQGRGCC